MDFTGYKTAELKNAADLDAYGVRKEAEARAKKAEKALAAALKKVAELQSEIAECGRAIDAAYSELAA